MRLAPASLRLRLVAGAVAVGLLFALAFGAVATWRLQRAEDQAIEAALTSRYDLALDEVAADGSLRQDAGSPKTDLVQVLGPDGTVLASTSALASLPPLVDPTTTGGSSAVRRISLQIPDIDLAVLARPLPLTATTDAPAGTGALVVAVDAEGFNTATTDLLGLLVAGLLGAVVAMGLLSWFLTGRALRSVTRLTERAEHLGPRELTLGLPVPRRDAELARLVRALNRMLTRLHGSHATELAFAADAGHRLRTPIATLRAEAELALDDPDPEQQSVALERIVQDADRLALIVDRMLARSRSSYTPPEPVLAALREAEMRWRRRAELAHIDLEIHLDPTITTQMLCSELVDTMEPVLDNALRHTPAEGRVAIRVTVVAGRPPNVAVEISNTGPPIPLDLVPHLFEAWVSSRDASVAGGLGLWLARETARDLGGDLELVGSRAETTFRMQLPALLGDAPGDTGPAPSRLPVR